MGASSNLVSVELMVVQPCETGWLADMVSSRSILHMQARRVRQVMSILLMRLERHRFALSNTLFLLGVIEVHQYTCGSLD